MMKKTGMWVVLCTLFVISLLFGISRNAKANNADPVPGLPGMIDYTIDLFPGANAVTIPYLTANRSIDALFGSVLANPNNDLEVAKNDLVVPPYWTWYQYSKNPEMFHDLGITDATYVHVKEKQQFTIRGYVLS